MSDIIDLRRSRENPEPNPRLVRHVPKKLEVPEGDYTQEQLTALQLTYYFERNGEIFGTSAIDAWNLKERIEGRGNPADLDIRFIGASDGAVYRAAMAEAALAAAPFGAEVRRYEKMLDVILKQEVDALGNEELEKEVAKKREYIQEKIQTAMDQMNEITNQAGLKAEALEIDAACKNGGKIPDFSIQGDALGIRIFSADNSIKRD